MAHLKKVPNGHLSKIPDPGPSTDCSTCEDCDGGIGSTITLTVSGFTDACSNMNGVYSMPRTATNCEWVGTNPVFNSAVLNCVGGGWQIDLGGSTCGPGGGPCALICISGNDHPIGSGIMTGRFGCTGQTGSFTIT